MLQQAITEIKAGGESVAADPVAAPTATEAPAADADNLAQSCSWWKFWC